MVIYMTSSPCIMDWELQKAIDFNVDNGFVDMLKKDWKADSKILFFTSAPDNPKQTDDVRDDFVEILPKYNLSFSKADVLDNRNILSKEEILEYDVIVLCGGHVPTQNVFMNKINLKSVMKEFNGLVIGISAGTMNCADVVYAQPELEGESDDLYYKRFLPGLALTEINVIPHWQYVKDLRLDGKKIIDDITIPDSYTHLFFSLSDGSFIRIDENGKTTAYGECNKIQNGVIEKIQGEII